MKNCINIGTLVLSLLLPIATQAQAPFSIHPGDRVVFYGDSITDLRIYTLYVETYIATRYPGIDVTFVHSGWGGDRVTGGGGGPIDVRLGRDVFPYQPSVMTIMLGMNDGSYRAFDEGIFNTYTQGYQHIVESVQKTLPHIRLTLIDPSPYDDVTFPPNFEGGYNAVLMRYGEWVKDYAQRVGATMADLNSPVVATLEKAKAIDPVLAKKIMRDRIHPNPAGCLVMAEAILKAWNAPALVTAVEIDGAKKQLVHDTGTGVYAMTSHGDGLTWKQVDKALPMPYDFTDPVVALVLRSSDFIEALDQEPLRVTGLGGERYTLKIDDQSIGTFTSAQLTEGINLAHLSTPMSQQAMAVEGLIEKHNTVHFTRWRTFQVPFAGIYLPHLQRVLDDMDTLEKDLVDEARVAAEPKPHTYELTPQ